MANILHINRDTGDITLGQLEASNLLCLDGAKGVSSVTDLTSWITGTADQIIVTDDTDGTITLSTPQNIANTSSPTFVQVECYDSGDVDRRCYHTAFGISSYSWRDSYNTDNSLQFRKSRGTEGTPTAVEDADWVSKWQFNGYNGAAYVQYGGFIYITDDVSETSGSFNFYYFTSDAFFTAKFGKENTRIGNLGTTGTPTTDYVQISSTTGDLTFAGGAGFYPRRISQSAEPANGTDATQIDVGELIIWRDPDDNKTYLVYQDTDEGVRKVELI